MKDTKKIPVYVAVMLIVVISSATFSLTYFFTSRSYYKDYKTYHMLSEIEYLIDNYYYEEPKDRQELINSSLNGYVKGLEDVYSSYQNIEKTEDNAQNHKGVYVGVGITVTINDDGNIKVIEVLENSPAMKSGIMTGDVITAVDGKEVTETGYEQSVDSVKGEVDTEVVLTVWRNETKTDYRVKRQLFDVVTVKGEMLEDGIGYISISQFNDKTSKQFKDKLDELLDNGAKGIIYDVRDNGGGLVYSVEDCLDPLLPEGEIAVAIYRNEKSETIVESDDKELNIPMVVLQNGGSASGAELFAASLRDFKNAELIGTKSYGKGVMQDTFTLSDGSTVILTVAKYKTTRSECYHGVGLVPDIEIEQDYTTEDDDQLKKAVEVMKDKLR